MTDVLLTKRNVLTESLIEDPYNIQLLIDRAAAYRELGYPDLAAADLYKGLLLVDEVIDDTGEYHEDALESLERSIKTESPDERQQKVESEAQRVRLHALTLLSQCLAAIGCLRSACDTLHKAVSWDPNDSLVQASREAIYSKASSWAQSHGIQWNPSSPDVKSLPDSGFVRREVYPWNDHESDRNSQQAIDLLNEQMSAVAPRLEVALSVLPALTSAASSAADTVTQLGVFARDAIGPGEEVLCERSLLTANSRLHEPLCDACSATLPELGPESTAVPCPECDDIIFCSDLCLDLATSSYHPAVCGADVDTIAKDVAPSEAADALYTQLLFRALAMSYTQEKHILDLMEVKYIWGDFTEDSADNVADKKGDQLFEACERTLPFSFQGDIVQVMHYLEKMDINPFTASYGLAEVWVYNTLLAKFRGTASARISPRDGRPEVAAVHPLWCLANHSCDPNVRWEWAGEIRFHARKERAGWRNPDGGEAQLHKLPGIKKGEEILNHYVDIDLPVKERREWGAGALGGDCKCERCVFEAAE